MAAAAAAAAIEIVLKSRGKKGGRGSRPQEKKLFQSRIHSLCSLLQLPLPFDNFPYNLISRKRESDCRRPRRRPRRRRRPPQRD